MTWAKVLFILNKIVCQLSSCSCKGQQCLYVFTACFVVLLFDTNTSDHCVGFSVPLFACTVTKITESVTLLCDDRVRVLTHCVIATTVQFIIQVTNLTTYPSLDLNWRITHCHFYYSTIGHKCSCCLSIENCHVILQFHHHCRIADLTFCRPTMTFAGEMEAVLGGPSAKLSRWFDGAVVAQGSVKSPSVSSVCCMLYHSFRLLFSSSQHTLVPPPQGR